MALHINELPKEILCSILDYLDNKEKLKVRLVCKDWKNQVDENVIFHIFISNQNYEEIRHQFEATRRRVKSIWMVNYSRPNIPLQNLSSLRHLGVSNDVNKLAVTEILSKATMLNTLQINVEHSNKNKKGQRIPGSPTLPGLQSIEHLRIGYYHCAIGPNANQTVWNQLLNENMPKVQTLTLDLRPYFPIPFGFEFFDLVAALPELCNLRMNVSTSRLHNVIPRRQGPQDLPFTSEICEGLRKRQLYHLAAGFLEKDMEAWRVLLSDQPYMRTLCLFIDRDQNRGFPLSLIQPVLKKSWLSLEAICLKIDTKINGDLDMKLFSQLKFLRSLKLMAWPNIKVTPDSNHAKVYNCGSVILEHLGIFKVDGFNFTEEEIINVVKNLQGYNLDRVQISRQYAATWKNFKQLLKEMDMKAYGSGLIWDYYGPTRLMSHKQKMVIEPGHLVMKVDSEQDCWY